jgi:predicted HAD superfamily Cof-like phosphohydrolase
MNKQEQVKEFMLTFNQPILKVTDEITTDRARLRIALLFEEVHELAMALGEDRYYHNLCEATLHKPIRLESSNKVEQLDALVDIRYVLNGTVEETGLAECFDEAFDEVHHNNMTKAASTKEEAIATCAYYTVEKKIPCRYVERNGKFIIYREDNDKVLKTLSYKPIDLSPILNRVTANLTAQKSLEI